MNYISLTSKFNNFVVEFKKVFLIQVYHPLVISFFVLFKQYEVVYPYGGNFINGALHNKPNDSPSNSILTQIATKLPICMLQAPPPFSPAYPSFVEYFLYFNNLKYFIMINIIISYHFILYDIIFVQRRFAPNLLKCENINYADGVVGVR